MSKAIGIVAEYNPFHNGHAHHLREAKRIAGNRPVIAAMSGSLLVQRGLPALTDKWTRARMAVLGGVDLVLELPTVFTCRSAEFFAAGAVKLLAATGMVSHLAFGAEAADSQQLNADRRIFERTCFSGCTGIIIWMKGTVMPSL